MPFNTTAAASVFVAMILSAGGTAHAQDKLSGGLAKLDANQDNQLTFAEFTQTVAWLFKKADTDKDGKLTHDEVAAYYGATGGSADPKFENRVANIMAADTNHDGAVTVDELTAQTAAEFKKRDRNGDGVITAADD